MDSDAYRDLLNTLIKIKNGNQSAREKLVEEYKPFVLKTANQFCKRALEWGRDDELSIGMVSFNSAIDTFDQDRQVPFLPYCRVVIENRLKDHFRKESKYRNLNLPDDENLILESQAAWDNYVNRTIEDERRDELEQFEKILADFSISFEDLVDVSPRHRDYRLTLFRVADRLVQVESLMEHLISKKQLPITGLEKACGVNRKTLERGRKFIICVRTSTSDRKEKEGSMMWFGKRGLVVRISDGCCIILTSKGTYERIPVPPQGARVGAEASYSYRAAIAPALKPMMLVASLLILFVGYSLFNRSNLPVAAAYVSLDINPSLELSVDKNMNVIDVKYFNDDAANLLKQERLPGKNLYAALAVVVDQAIAKNYIKAGQDNLIVSTVAPSGTGASGAGIPSVDQQSVQQFLKNSINKGGLTGEVRVYSVSGEFRSEAEGNGLSPGKYLVYEQLKATGGRVGINDVRKNSIRNLVDTYKLGLLPNYENIRIQRQKNGGEPDITVDDNGRVVSIADYLKNHGADDAASLQKANTVSGRYARPGSNLQGMQPARTAPVKNQKNKQTLGSRAQRRNRRGASGVNTWKSGRRVVGLPAGISTDDITWRPGDWQQSP
jgi:RNA polymerase sigma factor